MSEQLHDDQIWEAVRSARPAHPADHDSGVSPEAQALLSRILHDGGGRARSRPRRRSRLRLAPATLLLVVSVCLVVAIAFVALVNLGHRRPGVHVPASGASEPLRGFGQLLAAHSTVVPGSTKLIAEAPDPRGGLPWAVREVRTSRGQLCLTAGRAKNGVIGSIGEFGAWGDDGRFHPLPAAGSEVSLQFRCGDLDAAGHAFLNVTDTTAIANATGDAVTNGSARGAAARVELCPASSRTGHPRLGLPRPCPAGVLRNISYGVLGPQATSITYLARDGRTVTEPTAGPDGAYLIVAPQRAGCTASSQLQCAGGSVGPLLESGTIVAVHYRSGRVCRLPQADARGLVRSASCPLVGYQPPGAPAVSGAELAAPVSLTIPPAAHYCASNAPNPRGCAQIYLHIAFTARVAVSNLQSFYEAVIDTPPRNYTPGGRTGCPGGGGTIGPTQSTITADQRIHWTWEAGSYPKDCAGDVIHVTVAYVANARLGLNGVGSERFPSPGRGATVVGRATVTIPGG
jgi:hypothetical protein